jgi:hypothetical protein
MSGEQNLKTFRKPDDSIQEYRPFFFAVNELAGLLSVDFRKMVDFLVDLYDSEKFSTSFKRDEVKDVIPFPCATMLCGAVPEWFMRSLKMDLFSGGLGRRLTVVYEDRTILIDEPKIPPGGEEAWLRVCNHIRAANEFSGEMHMSESCKTWWKAWYMNYERLKSDDPILRQIYARKDVILKKVAMLTALDSLPFRLVLEPEDFIIALGMLDQLEPAIRKLSAGVGRNELAAISVDFVNFIGFNSGCASENQMKKAFFRECRTMGNEYQAMVNHLIQTEQVFAVNGKTNGKVENFFMTQERYEKYIKEGSKLNA